MRPGEEFEIRCFEYLRNLYHQDGTDFHLEGGMNSTKSDIAVIKDGDIDFYIEAKDTAAQSGQFVLHPNEATKNFIFSSRNKSKPNEMTDIMISYMNNDFNRFNNAGTAGESLDISSSVFSNWIMQHYKNKNVKYVISYNQNYVVLPIRRFATYFDIIAKYRIKKSGSGEPAKRDFQLVKDKILTLYPTAIFTTSGKKFFVEISDDLIQQTKFELGKYTYYFSRKNDGLYEIKRLSNTYNMNVIFSINLKKPQDPSDLSEFESDL